MLVIFTAAVLIIFLMDGVPLIKKKQWAEFMVFVLILAAAGILLVTNAAGIPAPLKSLNDLMRDTGKKLFG